MQLNQQKGLVLLLSLLILLILSIAVSSSVNTLLIDKKVVSNQRSQFTAMEAAESSLREAEIWLNAQTIQPIAASAQQGVWTRDSAVNQDKCAIHNSTWWQSNGITSQTTANSYYLIEEYDNIEDSLITAQNTDTESRLFYRITAMAHSRRSSQVVLQSLFARRFIDPTNLSTPPDLPLGRQSWKQCY
jgi:type IV pilus assembly protein PilX